VAAIQRQPGSPLTRRAFLLGACATALALVVGRRLAAVGGSPAAHEFRPKRADNLVEEARGDGLDLRPFPIDEQGPTFRLNGPGAFLWQRIDGTRSVDVLAVQFAAAYAVAPRVARADTLAFVRSMRRIGLVFDPFAPATGTGAPT